MKIVITDSGLGGLSVLGELERRLKENAIYQEVELIFFNSLYSSEYGYNSMKDISEKAGVFNNALNSICQNFNPDLILIACNTLSVVYPHTEFAKNPKAEVKGIVESGVSLFEKKLKHSEDKIILMGTPTTINSDVYKNALIQKGINANQIINQGCLELETSIQNDPNSNETRNTVSHFIGEAVRNIDSIPNNIYVGLCCTHYGYCKKVFYEELANKFNANIETLNPNNTMLDFLFSNSKKIFSNSNISIKIVSQVKLKENEINSLGSILEISSPITATALRNYVFVEKLFSKNHD